MTACNWQICCLAHSFLSLRWTCFAQVTLTQAELPCLLFFCPQKKNEVLLLRMLSWGRQPACQHGGAHYVRVNSAAWNLWSYRFHSHFGLFLKNKQKSHLERTRPTSALPIFWRWNLSDSAAVAQVNNVQHVSTNWQLWEQFPKFPKSNSFIWQNRKTKHSKTVLRKLPKRVH